MANFVLVHGAWLGAWCWDRVADELRSEGHVVYAPDLPGHGQDETPVSRISLASYADRIASELGVIDGQTVLVGHSMGGIVLSEVAERIPEKIAALVYVAAYLLRDGESIVQASEKATDSLVMPNMVPAPDWSTISIKPEALKDVFAADAAPADLKRLESLARPEPAAPFNTPVHTTAERFGSVARLYIKTALDRAVTPILQESMLAATPCVDVLTLKTSHTPFFAAPVELARALVGFSSR